MQHPKQDKSKRLEARITADQQTLIQQAAALEGRSVSDFAVSTLQAAAIKIIQEHQLIRLSARGQLDFANALLNPPKPNKKLLDAAKKHHKDNV